MPTTLRLLSTYNGNPPNTIITVDDAIATQLLSGGVNATLTLTGGTPYVPPVIPSTKAPVQAEIDSAGNVVSLGVPIGSEISQISAAKSGVTALQRVTGGTPGSGLGAGGGIGRLIDCQRTAPGPFVGVRLVFENYDTAAPMAVNRAIVSVTPTVGIGSGSEAGLWGYGPGGNKLTWTEVTFNGGSATGTVPQAAAGLGLPVNGSIRPGYLISDFIPIASVPRADNSELPFLRTRVHLNDNTFPLNLDNTPVRNLDIIANAPLTGGHMLLLATANETAVNLHSRATAPGPFGAPIEPVGVIYYTSTPTRTIAAFGDSLTQGGTFNTFGWPERFNAKYGKGPGLAFSVAQRGVGGSRLENSLANCRNYCNVNKPHYVTFFAWSPNNTPPTQAIMDSLWARVLQTIDHVQQLGITPVVLTSSPVNTFNATEAALWRAQNARVMALPASVVKIDSGRDLTEPGTYDGNAPKLALKYGSNDGVTYLDGVHYNNAGYELIADKVRAALR